MHTSYMGTPEAQADSKRTSPSYRGCLSNLDSKPRQVKGGPWEKIRRERDKPYQLQGD